MTHRNVVRVYHGWGNSHCSFKMLLSSLQRLLYGTPYVERKITPDELKNEKDGWQDDTKLLIIGGGFDRGFLEALGDTGAAHIRDFVLKGGSYLGICAGAYFGCDRIEFDKCGASEVCGERPLKFFPGKCIGPTFPGYCIDNEAGAHAVQVMTNSTFPERVQDTFYSYFNGGGHFSRDDDGDVRHCETLATYGDRTESDACIVKCLVGNGVSVLSGVHLEYDPAILDTNDVNLQPLIPTLTKGFPDQEMYFRLLLKHHLRLTYL